MHSRHSMLQLYIPECWNCPKDPWKSTRQGRSWVRQRFEHHNSKDMSVVASMHGSLCLLFHWTATIFPSVYLSLFGACCESTSTLHGGLQELFVPWINISIQIVDQSTMNFIPHWCSTNNANVLSWMGRYGHFTSKGSMCIGTTILGLSLLHIDLSWLS